MNKKQKECKECGSKIEKSIWEEMISIEHLSAETKDCMGLSGLKEISRGYAVSKIVSLEWHLSILKKIVLEEKK